MRWVPVMLVLALVTVPAAAEPQDPDWREGFLPAGAPTPVEGLNVVLHTFTTTPCHTSTRLDLLFDPDRTGITVPDGGSFHVLHEWRADVFTDDEFVSSTTVRHSGHGHSLGAIEPGEHVLRLWLRVGAAVDYELRVRVSFDQFDPVCNPPVE